MKEFLKKLNKNQDLTFDESKSAFEIIMNGKASEEEIFNFLTLLSLKGEVSDEIAGWGQAQETRRIKRPGALRRRTPEGSHRQSPRKLAPAAAG